MFNLRIIYSYADNPHRSAIQFDSAPRNFRRLQFKSIGYSGAFERYSARAFQFWRASALAVLGKN